VRRRGGSLLLIVLTALALLLSLGLSAAQAQDDGPNETPAAKPIAELLETVYADKRLQRSLPDRPAPIASDGSGRSLDTRTDGPKADDASRPTGGSGTAFPALLPGLGSFLFWGLIIALVVVFVVWSVSQWRSSSRDFALLGDASQVDVAASSELRTGLRARSAARGESLVHAAAGRFLEGAHVLLLDGLARAAPRGAPIEEATTSREFLQTLPTSSAQRTELAVLVAVVEEGLFAGRPLVEARFERSLQAFDRLIAAQART